MIFDILEELASDNSRLFKQALLEKHKDNDVLKEVFRLAYDPFTQFYIRKIPAYTRNTGKMDGQLTLQTAMPQLGMLSTRQVTGNAGIEFLADLLSRLETKDAQVLERIIGKDLKVGCSASTANKVWDKLIPEYPCMLCSQFDQKIVDKMKFPAMVQLKMDGMRFNAIVKDGAVAFRSRNGKEINLIGNLEQEFIEMARGGNVVFDGELVVSDKGLLLDRQTGNGILNKAVKGTIGTDEARKVHATVWDVIPLDHFVAGKGTTDYGIRFAMLQTMKLPSKVHLVEHRTVVNFAEAQEIFEKYLSEGQEGIILKDLRSKWEDKRSKGQIKMKGELECDLKIVGIQEGTGKYVGKVGAYLCESADGVIKVDVGSGFKDDQRTIDKSVIGKIVAVKYNVRIKNKQGEESLFLPIFLEVREDKTKADSSKDIK
jgi:ATP-dependent DNA ligase